MTLEEVVKLRDEVNKDSEGIIITMDNMMVFSDKSEIVIWDDANSLIYCIRANTNQYVQDSSPIEIISSTYEHIQYITGYMSSNNAVKTVEEYFVANGLMDEETKEKVNRYIRSMNNHLL